MNLPVEERRQWIKSRREQRKLTKFARLRRQFFRYSILSALLAAGAFAFYRIHWCLIPGNQTIDVRGNVVASNEQIRDALNLAVIYSPLYMLNPASLEKQINNLSIIKHAFVRRYALPKPRLEVEVLEEFPWGNLVPNFVIAESGRLIYIPDFPNVFKPNLKIYANDPAHIHLDALAVEHWANWTTYISKQTRCPVLAIDMREPHDVKIETSKFTLALGDPDSSLTHRLSRLASVLDVLAHQGKEPAYINLGLNSNIPVKLAKKQEKAGTAEKISRL